MSLRIRNHSDSVLHDISFELQERESLVILGSNGAGKTTLAKTIAGLRPSPNVTIDTLRIDTAYGKARSERINYIPPVLEVFDRFMRVKEYLALSHFNTVLDIDTALSICKIERLADATCATLSSGEAQLVMLCAALLHGARYTIFDEPAANLDPLMRKRLFDILAHTPYLQSRIVITHHLELAYKLAYKVCFIKEGRIVFWDESDAFFTPETLERFYGDTVRIVDSHIVEAL